jgi:hypothetical protein
MNESAPPTSCAAGLLAIEKTSVTQNQPRRRSSIFVSGISPGPVTAARGALVISTMLIIEGLLVRGPCKLGNASGRGKWRDDGWNLIGVPRFHDLFTPTQYRGFSCYVNLANSSLLRPEVTMTVSPKSGMIAVLSALAVLAGCNEAFSPVPNTPPGVSGGGLTVVPRSATIQAGQVVVLRASLDDVNGDRITNEMVSWRSNNEAVAAVTSTGEVLGRTAGHAVIAASAEGKTQTSFIQVTGKPPKPAPKAEN